MWKQHKSWEKYYNWKRREANIKANDLVLVQTHFISAAGRRVVEKFMPNIDQVQVYHPRQSDSISFDSNDETLYEGWGSSNGSSRSHPGKSRSSRRLLGDESKGSKSNKGTAGLEDLRLKHKVRSNGTVEKDRKRSKKDKARETRTTRSKGHSAAEGRPVRSRQTTAVRPCPYYLRSHLKEPEGIPEGQRSTGIDSLPQNSLRMEALDGDPADRSE
ncbi:uncharacterized protein TNCV_4364221 [Trichonephila clavipes]|nr:uncharacterized protein TNCV_4364221 [Trichonephila clavipes]